MERTCHGHIHIHALVDTPLSAPKVRESWQGGRAKVERYDPERGWRHYITKDLGDAAVDWDLSPHRKTP